MCVQAIFKHAKFSIDGFDAYADGRVKVAGDGRMQAIVPEGGKPLGQVQESVEAMLRALGSAMGFGKLKMTLLENQQEDEGNLAKRQVQWGTRGAGASLAWVQSYTPMPPIPPIPPYTLAPIPALPAGAAHGPRS